jgi:hypothetical protein
MEELLIVGERKGLVLQLFRIAGSCTIGTACKIFIFMK